MKAGKEHRVPLSDAALALLAADAAVAAVILYSRAMPGRPLGMMTMLLLRRTGRADIPARFSLDLPRLGRRAPISRQVVEMALAHAVGEAGEPPTGAATCSTSAAS